MKDASIIKTRGLSRVSSRGTSTLEILIAFAILTLTLTAAVMVIFENQSVALDAQMSNEALYKAQALLEHERMLSRQNFGSVVSLPAAVDGTFTPAVDVQTLDASTKKILSTVSWANTGRILSVQLSTLVTDFTNNNFCGAPLSGDWKDPQHYDFPTAALMPKNSPSGVGLSDIKAYQQKLYLAAYSTASNADTFYIFTEPSDPTQQPTYLGSVDNAPSISSAGLNAIALDGAYAFAANGYNANYTTCSVSSSCAQLQVIDVHDAAHPTVVKNIKVPGVTGMGGQAVGWSIFYDDGYVYLGLVKAGSGAEFNIFDVGGGGGAASPTNPMWKGSFTVGRTINSIRVQNNFAYLATDDNSRELVVLDVSDKTNPTLASIFNAPGSTNFGYGYDAYPLGTTIYFGRTYVGTAPEFYILDGTNPTSTPPILGSEDIGTTANPDSVNSLLVRGSLAFFITNSQFQIWNIADPKNIYPWSSSGATNTFLSLSAMNADGSGGVLTCSGNTLYAAIQSSTPNSDSLSVITPGP